MSVDFAAVKLVPIASVLAHYKVQVRKRSNTELVCKCPLPSHLATEHKNNNETFCIGLEKGKWWCHSDACRVAGNHPKGGDVIDLVSRLDNSSPLEAAKKLAELFCLPAQRNVNTKTVVDNNVNAVIEKPNVVSSPDVAEKGINHYGHSSIPTLEVNRPLAFVLKDVNPVHPFIQSRGISVETAVHFNVGYFPGAGSMKGRIVFPLYENGSLIGYAGRTILEVSDENCKWKLPAGLHRTFLYGLEKCEPSKVLLLVESPWAVLWFHQHNHQAAALIGSSLTEAQERLLEPYGEIKICMDNDSVGREAAEKLAARLKTSHKVTKAFLKD